jgi:flagellar basal body-associated protein FliL
MAEIPEEEVQEEDAPPRKAGMILPILLAVMASGIGGGVGMTLMGPSLGSWMAANASEDGGKKKSGGGGGGHGGAGGASAYHVIENLVVNPAGSEGNWYLLVTVAIETEDPDMVAELAAMDVPLRHSLLSYLGSRTVQDLTEAGAMEALVEELKIVLTHEVGEIVLHRIYLPQYVIQ